MGGIRPERAHRQLVREARLWEQSESGEEGFLVTLESYGGDPPRSADPWGGHAIREPGTGQSEPTIWPAVFATKIGGGWGLESQTHLTTTTSGG